MREKTLRLIITFHTTTEAMAMETYCEKHGIAGRLIPVPPVISAGCGMCWSAPLETRAELTEAIRALHGGHIYELLL